jgi:hypothetical protein
MYYIMANKINTRKMLLTKKRSNTRKKTRKMIYGTGKKWTTALDAANATFKNTGSLNKAKRILKLQALSNARRIFGSV